MTRAAKQLEILVYQDVLCVWCYVADLRLETLQRELGDVVRFRRRPYPLRPGESLPTGREIHAAVQDLEAARAEREQLPLCPELWTSGDPPRGSLDALAALEAARLQGEEVRARLARSMQRLALEQGVNVTRTDVVFELASRAGLQMNRFAAAFGSPQTRRLILEEHRDAAERGVRRVPTLVIGGRWMISGLRDLPEYRDHILACLGKLSAQELGVRERLVH